MQLQPVVLSQISAADAIIAFQIVGALFLILLIVAIASRSAG
jgi:hypothetical protein